MHLAFHARWALMEAYLARASAVHAHSTAPRPLTALQKPVASVSQDTWVLRMVHACLAPADTGVRTEWPDGALCSPRRHLAPTAQVAALVQLAMDP
jgi:hypothetical protein